MLAMPPQSKNHQLPGLAEPPPDIQPKQSSSVMTCDVDWDKMMSRPDKMFIKGSISIRL